MQITFVYSANILLVAGGRKPFRSWCVSAVITQVPSNMAWRSAKSWSLLTKAPSMLGMLVGIFLMCNIFLLRSFFEHRTFASQQESPLTLDHLGSLYFTTLRKHFVQINNQWRLSPHSRHVMDLFNKNYSRAVSDTSTKKIIDLSDNELNCLALKSMKSMEFVATGWTKVSYKTKYKDKDVAIKTVNVYGHDVTECLQLDQRRTLQHCYKKAASKILKEIALLKDLVHKNIVKVLGYCVPDGEYTGDSTNAVSVITELGEPLDVIKLLQMSWEDRLRVSLGIADLLYHLAHSKLGSLLMNDFRRQQFVLVNGELKLSDLDDISFGDPLCRTDKDCVINLKHGNSSLSIPCFNGRCKSYNEKQNIIRAGRHFMSFIFPHGAPVKLRPLVDEIVDAYNTASWDTETILKATLKVVDMFIHGHYRNASAVKYLSNYRVLEDSDLLGHYDYRCQLTLSGYGCTLSMFDVEEAAAVCSSDAECKAFVFTNHKTWTGRTIVHFKNGFSSPVKGNQTVLYVRIV